jgi:nicotinate-nucleotide adenylyltransferase
VKVGLYGGSFDPIHFGHLLPVRQAKEALALDRVMYLPTARPPHKARPLAPGWARYAMVELALLREEGMFASSFEMRRERASYTVDTVEHFRAQLPAARLFLVVGSDSYAELPTWRAWRRILEAVEIVILARPGWELAAKGPGLAPELRRALETGRARAVANAPVGVSSTEVRRAIVAGADHLSDLIPPLVLNYIAKYGLYRHERGS